MDTRDLRGRLALVTGAASGIGRATALLCAERGADLALCDLDETGLAEVQARAEGLGRRVLARRVDVADADAMGAFAEAVHAEAPAVDLLVNNAGVAVGGGLLDTTLEDWGWILGVNLRGVVHGCHHFVPAMTRQRGGHVVIVSSLAGYLPSPTLLAYNATKFAVLGLAEALADELAPHDVGVTAICPGVIDTPITRNTRLRGVYDDPRMRERVVEAYRRRGYTPERVARAILTAVRRGRIVAPVSPESWVLYYLRRWAPGPLRFVSRRLAERARRELLAPPAAD